MGTAIAEVPAPAALALHSLKSAVVAGLSIDEEYVAPLLIVTYGQAVNCYKTGDCFGDFLSRRRARGTREKSCYRASFLTHPIELS